MFLYGKQEEGLAGDRIRNLSHPKRELYHYTTRPTNWTKPHLFFIAQTNDLIMTQFMPLVDLVTLADFHRALTIFVI